MRVRALAAALLLSGACAHTPRAGVVQPAGPGWSQAVAGDDAGASAAFDREGNAPGLFGAAALAFERGDSAAALDDYLRVLQLAGSRPEALALAAASAARVGTLLEDLPGRGAAEARVLALDRRRLPWPAQMELADVGTAIARRHADGELMAREVRRAGCVREAVEGPLVGTLPHLDLEAPEPPGPSVPVQASGCRLSLPPRIGHPGVRVLRARIDVTAGSYDVALSFSGPALLRVDGGLWHRHGSPSSFGPRWSAARLLLARGRHDSEVRLGTYGGATELTVLTAPAVDVPPVRAAGIDDLAVAIEAELTGDADRALESADRLQERRRYALGLAAAGRVALHDASRPANIGRDAARALFRRAVAVDDGLARVWRELALLELTDERTREAAELAEHALRASPGYLPAAVTLSEALRARGLERYADRALAAAQGPGLCAAVEAGLRQARELGHEREEDALAARLGRCDAQADVLLDRLRARGDLAGLERLLRARLPTSADPAWVRTELAEVLLARGQARAAADELAALVAVTPLDVNLRVRLADALLAAGDSARARATVSEAVRLFPTRLEARQAARALGLPLPLDAFRIDGREVIHAFAQAGRRYDAPAVMVLDRTVERVFPDGARLVLTHEIVRVQSKDGIERWGEVAVPDGAEVLTLRTHKADGSVREPEEIIGKATVSVPDLAVGDYVEWETVEMRDPTEAFAPGFLGDRFYFQSPEAPLDRSEYVLLAPAAWPLDQDRRAGAPPSVEEAGPEDTRVLRFEAHHVPQLFPERAAVPAVEWIPSVRVSSGVTVARWSRFLADQLYGVGRASPAMRQIAAGLATGARGDRTRLPGLITAWVGAHIEPEADLLEPASFSVARGRGNRAAVLVGLAGLLGVPAELVFARPLTTAAADSPAVPQQLDDFSEALVRFPDAAAGPARYIDPRLRRAPLGYLPPTVDGAPLLAAAGSPPAAEARARSAEADRRAIRLSARLGAEGQAAASVVEDLRGWPAIEWMEIMDRVGEDRVKLRQEFEQRWLSQNFPGATLGELAIDVPDPGAARAVLRYTFTHPALALRDGNVLRLAPTFFRARPGHRFAAEARRRTTLLLGFDVPLDLEAHLLLPPGARLVDPGDSGSVVAGGARFAEQREGSAGEVVVRREARLPLLRVSAADYPGVAAQLRRVDPLEQSEIRVALPAATAPESADRRLGGAGGDPAVH